MANIDVDMNDRQLPNGTSRSYAITQPARARGLASQTYTVLLQPGAFFRSINALEYTRQWLWIGLVILVLVGLSAVRQASLTTDSAAPVVPDFGLPPEGGDFSGGGGGISVSPLGGPPPDAGIPDSSLGGGASSSNIAATWTTALIAASGVLLGWAIQTALLAEVSLLRGFAPHLGRNLQIAIWSSVPLGLMAALQLLYYAAGGTGGASGVSGLLAEWEGYSQLPTFSQSILLSLTSRLTLFWLWSLVLIYIGARRTLGGRWWSSILVVIAWVVVVVVLPVITGAIQVPEPELGGEFSESEILPEDLGIPFDESGDFTESELIPAETESSVMVDEIDSPALEEATIESFEEATSEVFEIVPETPIPSAEGS